MKKKKDIFTYKTVVCRLYSTPSPNINDQLHETSFLMGVNYFLLNSRRNVFPMLYTV